MKAIREDTLTIEKDRFLETVFGVISRHSGAGVTNARKKRVAILLICKEFQMGRQRSERMPGDAAFEMLDWSGNVVRLEWSGATARQWFFAAGSTARTALSLTTLGHRQDNFGAIVLGRRKAQVPSTLEDGTCTLLGSRRVPLTGHLNCASRRQQ